MPAIKDEFMPRNQPKVFQLSAEMHYIIHPDHRDSSPQKSQWTISERTEKDIFVDALARKWVETTDGWGLWFPNGKIAYVGMSSDNKRQLFIARFVDGTASNIWHGYPADHQRCQRDMPSANVLGAWLRSGALPRPKLRKLMKGQPCNL